MQACDLALLFFTPSLSTAIGEVAAALQALLRPRVLLGCVGEGVIAGTREIESEPALALFAAQMPGVQLTPFYLQSSHSADWAAVTASQRLFQEALGTPQHARAFLLFADPFSVPLTSLHPDGALGVLDAFNAYYPGLPVVGGVASGVGWPGSITLLYQGQPQTSGLVGVALQDADPTHPTLSLDVVVSQGCRPIGPLFRATRTQQTLIFELDHQPALAQVQAMAAQLDRESLALLSGGLYLGRAIQPAVMSSDTPLRRGDFLIRGVLGAEPSSGAIAVGDFVEEGELVQFHVRDASTAQEDLELLLTPHTLLDPPKGVWLFACNGRGRRLYDHPDGDVRIVQSALSGGEPLPLAGTFCGGEIGPIQGRNFLHGHTAVTVLFR